MNLEHLYKTYEKLIYGFLYGLTGNRHTAEELTQETFFQVVKSFYRFRGDAHVTTWLYGIARNVYRGWCRKQHPSVLYSDDIVLVMSTDDPAISILQEEEANYIRTVMLMLPERYREVLLLRDQLGLHYQEIAMITGLSLPSVKVTIFRARQRFRELYGEMSRRDGI